MSLFFTTTVMPRIRCESFVFVEVDKGFIYPLVDIEANTKLTLGRQVPLNGMFELFELARDNERIGYMFKTSFTVENGGGFLITYLKNKGLADSHEVLLKLDTLVIYNFPNRGTLAISPKCGPEVQNVLENQ